MRFVTCACGNTWTTGSTKKDIHTDVCSNCHPFHHRQQRIVDTAGQVERFIEAYHRQRTDRCRAARTRRKTLQERKTTRATRPYHRDRADARRAIGIAACGRGFPWLYAEQPDGSVEGASTPGEANPAEDKAPASFQETGRRRRQLTNNPKAQPRGFTGN